VNALSRIGRKRRDRQIEPDELAPFAVDRCECLVDGPFALLRLTGTGSNPPVTLATDGEHPQQFEPLPQPDAGAPDGVWRTAFAIPAELAEPGTRLWLFDGGEFVTDVRVPPPPAPAPSEHEPVLAEAVEPVELVEPVETIEPVAVVTQPAVEEGDDSRARKLVEAWSEAARLREQLSDRELELSQALEEALAARTDVDPLRARVAELTDELDVIRGELELAHRQGREARLRATEKAAELDAVRTASVTELDAVCAASVMELETLRAANVAELETLRASGVAELTAVRGQLSAELDAVRAELVSVEPRLTEALQATERAEREAASMREQVQRLENELFAAREQLATTASSAADQQRVAEDLESELTKLKEQPKSRRRGLGRRGEDRDLGEVRTELEARIAEQQERIAELEQEAASFAERRDEAVSASLRERVAELEEELRQHASTGDDLRALIASERELVATARGEVRDLKDQLATATAKRAVDVAPTAPVASKDAPAAESTEESGNTAPARAAVEPPPWSALDDELLARIEKAKALTG
jgi:chromosome segregation ATPase